MNRTRRIKYDKTEELWHILGQNKEKLKDIRNYEELKCMVKYKNLRYSLEVVVTLMVWHNQIQGGEEIYNLSVEN